MRSVGVRSIGLRFFLCLSAMHLCLASALAAPTLRKSSDQNGDILVFGNTVGQDCDHGYPANIVVGTLDTSACPSSGGGNDDDGMQVMWTTDGSIAGTVANATVTPSNAKSRAIMQLPPGASVTYARLYWTGVSAAAPSSTVTIARPSVFTEPVSREFLSTVAHSGGTAYVASAEITPLLQTHGSGVYDVSGIDVRSTFKTQADEWGGWYVVVYYQRDADPLRNLTLFDPGDATLDVITGSQTLDTTISGFLVPNAGFDAKLGVFGFEGDDSLTGDYMQFGPSTSALTTYGDTGAVSPATNNFFNGSRYWLGTPQSIAGDLPQFLGTNGSYTGFDMDVINVTGSMSPGQSSAVVRAGTGGEVILFGGFVMSITTFKPSFVGTAKTASDINGAPALVGDVIEFTIDTTNEGTDASIQTVVTDVLPAELEYVPGSLSLDGNPLSDAADGDVGMVSGQTITVHIGTGATSLVGGRVPIGGNHKIVLRARITSPGDIPNQASVSARGEMSPGLPAASWNSGDGNLLNVPTTVNAVTCASDFGGPTGACAANSPFCIAGTCEPCNNSVGSTTCSGSTPICATVGSLQGTCLNASDSDGDGRPNSDETTTIDSDNDGVPDYLDTDDDNDGILTSQETADVVANHQSSDVDGDGIPNYIDLDSDGDGITDANEGRNDTDGDGIEDYLDPVNNTPGGANGDDDNDGLTAAQEAILGSDPTKADTDGDGIGDGQETNNGAALDTDGDTILDVLDTDDDNDGTSTMQEIADALANGQSNDVDSDGTPNYRDLDSDGDGAPDGVEGRTDTDGDGVEDYLDFINNSAGGVNSDDDGDGLTAAQEAALGSDPTKPDTDGDGINDKDETLDGAPKDTDNDTIPDVRDQDDDNDGIPTATEIADTKANGQTNDVDGDSIPNYLDTDSDGDSVPDFNETRTDTDSDGVEDYLDPVNNTPGGASGDDDGDGLTAAQELTLGTNPTNADSDGDGINDSAEAPNGTARDSDGDGLIDALDPDDDGDGILTSVEIADAIANGQSNDADGDGVPNYLDLDSDGDGLLDGIESRADTDGDGIEDYLDFINNTPGGVAGDDDGDGLSTEQEKAMGSNPTRADTDNDGVVDGVEAPNGQPVDTDRDGIPDILDPDDDNDGLSTADEIQDARNNNQSSDVDRDGIPNHIDDDSDGDGIADAVELRGDSDGDGIEDYLDPVNNTAGGINGDDDGDGLSAAQEKVLGSDPTYNDSDLDGVSDGLEAPNGQSADTDRDGILDIKDTDDDNDTLLTSFEYAAGLIFGHDPDDDGKPNWLDVDSDDDGILDIDEKGDVDRNEIPDRLDPTARFIGGGSCSLAGRTDAETSAFALQWLALLGWVVRRNRKRKEIAL